MKKLIHTKSNKVLAKGKKEIRSVLESWNDLIFHKNGRVTAIDRNGEVGHFTTRTLNDALYFLEGSWTSPQGVINVYRVV